MRERAEAATPDRWLHMCMGSEGCQIIRDAPVSERRYRHVAWFGRKGWMADHADAEYVAGMSPAVALAVAAWLEQEAVNAGAFAGHGHMLAAPSPHALTVARAYLADQIEALAEVAGTFTKEG